MNSQDEQTLGGIVHTYQRYDPVHFPSPSAPPPDMVSPLFDHLLEFGDTDEFTEEQLANAVRLDASQIGVADRQRPPDRRPDTPFLDGNWRSEGA